MARLPVEAPSDYKRPSFRTNALGVVTKLVTPHSEYLALGQNAEQ
jgi:hypothetical protein